MRTIKHLSLLLPLLAGLLLHTGCESRAPYPKTLEPPQSAMTYSASEVAKIRNQHNVDQRAMAIDGVLSVGVAGTSSEDAWIHIQCKDLEAISKARSELGDSLAGVPIKFSLTDSIRAQ